MYKINSKKWFLGICFAELGVFLLWYVYLSDDHQLQTRIVDIPIPGWNFNTSRDIRQYILPETPTALQQPTHLCSKSLFILIIVCSAVDNFDSRNAIRRSWGSETYVNNVSVKITFLLGQTENQTIQTKLYGENQEYDDIIQERFIDSYYNLTLKSVMLLKWMNNHCTENVKFVMKTDDDMFVNVPPLVKLLKTRIKPTAQLIGHLFRGVRPVANTTHKSYAPKYMYPYKIYPNFLSGCGYVMSSDTVIRLYKAALSIPLIHLEDVYISGICAWVARIRPQNHPGFSYKKRKFDPCVYKDKITSHQVTPKEMHKMFLLLRQPDIEDICKEQ